jgi:predicted phage baseplate assembly protein
VRVNSIRWPERETLLDLDGDERGCVTSTDDDGNVTVRFGDGSHGARLPTGVENVSAVYRTGIGQSGNVDAGAISTLASRPLGVQSVVNPEPATGGADPEGRDQARQNAPLAVLALDRLVSVEDYASFARTYAGIGKAHADQLTDGRRSVVHLTIAGAEDAPIDVRSDLYRNLQRSLRRYGDPSVPLQVEVREAVFLVVVAKVQIRDAYLWESVAPEIRTALLDTFSFDRRELGQAVRYSEVVAAMQAVDGVDLVDIDLLDGIAETDATDPEVLADRLDALGASAAEATPPPDRVRAETTRLVSGPASSERTIRPAQIAYLNPELPDTLILTEGTP